MWKSLKRSIVETKARLFTVPSVKTISTQDNQPSTPSSNDQDQTKSKPKKQKRQHQQPKLQQYIPNIKYARVASVYDGDTITIATTKRRIFSPSATYAFKVRIAKIDCPEIRGSPQTEHQFALLAKEFVTSRLLNKVVKLQIHGYDKYGRLLADVYYTELPHIVNPNPLRTTPTTTSDQEQSPSSNEPEDKPSTEEPEQQPTNNSKPLVVLPRHRVIKYGTNLADALLAEGLAVPYDGKTKSQPDWDIVFREAIASRSSTHANDTPNHSLSPPQTTADNSPHPSK